MLAISFVLKRPLAIFMYNHFPFFTFNGLKALNIMIYEVIALVIMFSLLSIVLKLLMVLTNTFEKILKMTILLGLPSKILGGILGLLENYVIIFVVLYFISLPMFNLDIKETKVANFMLNNTPILSSKCSDTVELMNDFRTLKENYKDDDNSSLNDETIKLLTKYNIISKENVENLIKDGKL